MYYRIFTSIILKLLLLNVSYSQISGGEIFIKNASSIGVTVKVYPVSMVFNNDQNTATNESYANYNLVAMEREISPPRDFINCLNRTQQQTNTHGLNPGNEIAYEFDWVGVQGNGTKGSIGYGIYRYEFFWASDPVSQPPDDYFTLEIDFGYNDHTPCATSNYADLKVEFRNPVGNDRVFYRWISCECQNYPWFTLPTNRALLERDRCPGQYWPPNYGNFKYNNGTTNTPNPYNIIPQEPRWDCTYQFVPGAGNQNNLFIFNNDVGLLPYNLTIEKNVTTRIDGDPQVLYYLPPPPITIRSGATLKLTKGVNNLPRMLSFEKYQNHNFGTDLYILSGSKLELEGSSIASERAWVFFYFNYVEVAGNGTIQMGENSII